MSVDCIPSQSNADSGTCGVDPQKSALALSKSASVGSLALSRHRKLPSHLPAPKKKTRPKKIATQQSRWNDRHHLSGTENELLPKRQRRYFSYLETEDKLKETLRNNPKFPMVTSMLERLESEEVVLPHRAPISSDAGPPVLPSKHERGGTMRDHEHEIQPWNERHCQGIGNLNQGMHPLHREYFSQPSLFAIASSQRWRRYADVEIGNGVWKPVKQHPKWRNR